MRRTTCHQSAEARHRELRERDARGLRVPARLSCPLLTNTCCKNITRFVHISKWTKILFYFFDARRCV